MSSPMSDISDLSPPPPRRRQVDSDEDEDNNARSESPAAKPAKPLEEMFDDDEDEEPAAKSRSRRRPSPKDSDDDLKDDISELADDDDLFGDGGMDEDMDDAEASRKVRSLDDPDLDSGDDLGADPRRRLGRDDGMDYQSEEERDETSYEVDIGLHKLPQSTNDEVYLLKIPQFISIAPQVFKPETFQAPKLPPDAAITPYTFATSAIRWRRSHSDPSKLESNSRIVQWSDGTFSLQIGSSREGLYDLPTNPLIPPRDRDYNPSHDSFTFLAEPLANSRLVRFFTHATQGMGVVSASDNLITDDIKQMVAARYKASQKRRTGDGSKQLELAYMIENPEQARKDAEALEREVEKNRKKIEAQKLKETEAGANGFRRRARRDYGARDGMGMEDLEEEGGYERPKKSGGYRGAYREDEYDDDDGFVEKDPDSDEEEDIVDDSEEEEEYQSSRKKEKKSKKEKRRRREEEEDEDEEPEAEFTDGDDDDRPQRAKSPGKPKARTASEADEDDEEDGDLPKAPERKRRRHNMLDDSDDE